MYGVDECRRCGAPIKPFGPEAVIEYEQIMRRAARNPGDEAWRKQGILAPPTRRQQGRPWIGCCFECAHYFSIKTNKPVRRFSNVVIAGVIAFAVIWILDTYILV